MVCDGVFTTLELSTVGCRRFLTVPRTTRGMGGFGHGNAFVDHERAGFAPELIVGSLHFFDDSRVLVDDVRLVWILFHVV